MEINTQKRGGGEIPKGECAGRARSLGVWPRGGGGRDHVGRNPWDTGLPNSQYANSCLHVQFF